MKKLGAMEMSVGTIVTIVLLMAVLVLGLVMVRQIFGTATKSVNIIDDQVTNEINNLFGDSGDTLVVSLGNQNTAEVKQGTENFGIPIGFSPMDPAAWGTGKQNCKYSVTAADQPTYCINQGWARVNDDIKTGSEDVSFDQIKGPNGYALIKIDVPETVSPCLQRFNVVVSCEDYNDETTSTYFDIEVIKKGLF